MLNGVHMLVRVRVEGVGEEEEGEDRVCMGGHTLLPDNL